MPYLWYLDLQKHWVPVQISSPAISLHTDQYPPVSPLGKHPADLAAPPPQAVILGSLEPVSHAEIRVLLSTFDAGFSVNEVPISRTSGARVLRDRDAIRHPGGWISYFSTERLAIEEVYPGPDAVRCPRCRKPIKPGEHVGVLCPACKTWHHGSVNGVSCWRYAKSCGWCDFQTEGSERLQWSPEDL